MTARILAPAVAAVLASAAPALAFHPFQHWCGSHHGHHQAPQMVVPFAAQSVGVHSVGVHSVGVHSVGVQAVGVPLVQSFGVQTYSLQPAQVQTFSLVPTQAAGSQAESQALRDLTSLLGVLKTGCSLINPQGGAPNAAVSADLKRIKADLDLIIKHHKIKRPTRDTDSDDVDNVAPSDDTSRAAPRVSPRLARVDAGLDELEAIQRRTAERQAAAVRPRTTTPAEAPAVTRRN